MRLPLTAAAPARDQVDHLLRWFLDVVEVFDRFNEVSESYSRLSFEKKHSDKWHSVPPPEH